MKKRTSEVRSEIRTDRERRQLFLRYLNRGWLALGILSLVTLPIYPQQRTEFTWVIAITFPTYLIIRSLNLSGRTRLAGVIFAVLVNFGFYSLFLMLVRYLGPEEAFDTQATVWQLMGIAILLAGALVDKWAAPVLALFNSILLIATRLILSPASEPRPSAIVFWFMLALIIWLYEGTLSRALSRLGSELNERKQAEFELSNAYDATITGWSKALDLRDKETEGHTQRVTDMTLQLAHNMGTETAELVYMARGALLHDIGKMGVPDRILFKPDSLTEDEWVIMRKHPDFAYEMLSPIGYLQNSLEIPFCHHEKWDGSGYPRHLKGDEIPLSARIFAVADVWDALTSDRPYRPAWSRENALTYIKEQSGRHFDPKVVDAFLKMMISINPHF